MVGNILFVLLTQGCVAVLLEVSNNGHYVGVYTEYAVDWYDSLSFCESINTTLASIHSSIDNTRAYNSLLLSKTTTISEATFEFAWIGYNDISHEGIFEWSDLSMNNYTNWNTHEPNDYYGAEDCTHFIGNSYLSGRLWNDLGCTINLHQFVCNINPSDTNSIKNGTYTFDGLPTPAPTTAAPSVSPTIPTTGPTPMPTSPTVSPTYIDFFEYDNTRYIGVWASRSVTWFQAFSYCNSIGTTLASIHSIDESNFARDSLIRYYTSEFGYELYGWIGLVDLYEEGTFIWTDGTDVNYTNWGEGEPNDYYGEDCTHIREDFLTWNDIACDCYCFSQFVCNSLFDINDIDSGDSDDVIDFNGTVYGNDTLEGYFTIVTGTGTIDFNGNGYVCV